MTKATYEDLYIVENENSDISKFFMDQTVEYVCEIMDITKYQLDNSGLKIYTTYSPTAQAILAKNGNLTENFSKEHVSNSSVLIDNSTGYVLAYTSSLGYEIFRQAGSTVKPLVVYAPAVENDIITLATPIDDGQIKIGDWTPKNYGDKYVGITNIREGIKQSSNTIAVKVASYVGEESIFQYGKALGLSLADSDKNLTLSLGATAKGQSPLQMASAYSVFSNKGKKQNTTFVRCIVDNGKKVYCSTPSNKQIFSNETAYLITDCLIDTVKDGTARTLSGLPFELASKTGTVSNNNGVNTDAWNISYTPQYTLAIWHGDADETGGGHPTRHAYNIWRGLYDSESFNFSSSFNVPEGIVKLPIDTYSTKKLNQVAIATENTPIKYVKNEFFKKSNPINIQTSLFESSDVNFDISVEKQSNMVKITLFAEDIFTYKIVRTDILGERVVGNINGMGKQAIFYDQVLLTGIPIEYKVIAYVKGQEHATGSCTKKIII